MIFVTVTALIQYEASYHMQVKRVRKSSQAGSQNGGQERFRTDSGSERVQENVQGGEELEVKATGTQSQAKAGHRKADWAQNQAKGRPEPGQRQAKGRPKAGQRQAKGRLKAG